jgi:phosphatidylinositol-3-phosphatase
VTRATYWIAIVCLSLLACPVSAQTPKHVILVMMENHGTDTLVGNKADAPFFNELIAQKGVTLATQYYGVTHPSLPNYLALVSGDYWGILDDCRAGADVTCKPEEFTPDAADPSMKGQLLTDDQMKRAETTPHLCAGQTIVDQLEASGKSWKIYMQGMAADRKLDEYAPLGADGKPIAKLYAQKHNPFVYFASFHDDLKHLNRLLPYADFTKDLGNDGLPNFAWISPDQCHDMHGISEESAAAIKQPECAYPKSGLDHSVIKLGDDYLRDLVTAIKSASVWKDDTAVLIVWDEDDYMGASGTKGSPIGRNGVVLGGSRAPVVVVSSADRPARTIDAPFNHYNLLATLEAAYGLPCLGHACEVADARIPDLFK